MIKIALTGGIGCGKSTVCQLFSQFNVPIIDTDIIARNLVEPNSIALNEITAYFGHTVLLSNGSLNRKALAHIIFNEPKKKQYLESILHPKIKLEIQQKITTFTTPYVIIVIPLLIETNQQKNYDRILVIDCTEQQQIERTLARDTRDLNEIKSIITSQVSREKRLSTADDIIDNSMNENLLAPQVEQLHQKFMAL
ncbi:Dephospho-CoA kinase [hydrothermal vent metagenome]|uniref:Dephospho-CoA kinase n=1 Tax=hydrothermal vent metagenome TaxID=652676 RepID=A0A3B0XK20_9ZZZZ